MKYRRYLAHNDLRPSQDNTAIFFNKIDDNKRAVFIYNGFNHEKVFRRLRELAGPEKECLGYYHDDPALHDPLSKELGPGPSTNARVEPDPSLPREVSSQSKLNFIVQIRGGLNGSAVPELRVDTENSEISFNWIGLFTHFFGEEKVANEVLGLKRDILHDSKAAEEVAQRIDSNVLKMFYVLSLIDRGLKRRVTLQDQLRRDARVARMRSQVAMWRNNMKFLRPGYGRLSRERLQLKRSADLELWFSDDGTQERMPITDADIPLEWQKRGREIVEEQKERKKCSKKLTGRQKTGNYA
ncbi:hypothetical protein OEA41_001698 [Lepraria neglecta]|uniref:Uncharacterized protein n=1 Tax=Lepraria neglecta TaxID=209136 RepID=A0AAE0DLP8_9LECA|nr:hypothetical protein OEA41_001698 [Lepraria neglecta]